MGRHYQILLPLFSLFLVRVDLTDLWPLKLDVEILEIYDGDTVLIKNNQFKARLRFSKVDAPEKGQPFADGRGDAGEYSRKCLVKLLSRQNATLTIEGFDMYGRILGDLDKTSYALIKSGCSCLYPHAKFANQKQKYIYLRAFQKAKRLKKGLWAQSGVEQPKNWRRKNRSRFKKRSAVQR